MTSQTIPRTLALSAAVACLAVAAVFVLTRLTPYNAIIAGSARPEVLFVLPAFTLTDQHGRPFGSEDLAGLVWIADFMFTRCPGVCPMLTRNMAAIQDQLRDHPQWDRIRLISISVDFDHDTSAVLRRYAEQHGADPEHWFFLSGPRHAVWPLIESGFRLPVAEDPDNPVMPFTHKAKFVLLDGKGRIRGYFDGLSDPASLLADLEKLLDKP